MTIVLQPKRPRWHPIEFSIDFDTGEIRGRDAHFLTQVLRSVQLAGGTPVEPSPATWVVTDPFELSPIEWTGKSFNYAAICSSSL